MAAVGTASTPVDLTKVQPYSPPASGPSGGPVPYGGSSTQAILDDFNRPDGPIGANWTVLDGSCSVSNNAAVCAGAGRATSNGASGSGDTAEMHVAANGTFLQYAALLLNFGAGSSNLFLKVQNQRHANPQFGHAACYIGNNGTAFGLGLFDLSSPFSTTHMKATRSGSTVTLESTNIDGGAQPDQTYLCNGAPPAEGTGPGIGGWDGIARMDNFAVGVAAAPADVSGTKTVSGGPHRPGGSITYTIVLANGDPVPRVTTPVTSSRTPSRPDSPPPAPPPARARSRGPATR